MSSYIDDMFIHKISVRLRNFKQVTREKWQHSCPLCGDSKKNKLKARGFIFRHGQNMFYKCFNCSASMSFGNFLKQVSPFDYEDYVVERYKNGLNKYAPHKDIKEVLTYETPKFDKILIERKKILDKLIPAVDNPSSLKYIQSRQIPEDKWNLLYYTDDFCGFINSIIPDKFDKPTKQPRLVIPCFNDKKEIIQLTGRALGDSKMRYIHIALKEEEKVYGVERIDYTKRIIAVEGQFDSLFLYNCIAASGSNFNGKFIQDNKDNITVVYDNEPRSKTIMKLMEKSIKDGFSVCIWNDTIHQKDINEMYLAGVDVQRFIEQNTYSGIEAQLKFGFWRKC
jgi:hypothetical protein